MSNLPENVQSSHPADDPGSPQGADYHAGLHNDVNAMVNGLSELVRSSSDSAAHTELKAGDIGTGLLRIDGTRARRRILDAENPPTLLSLGSLMVYHGRDYIEDETTRPVTDVPSWTRYGPPIPARFPINPDGGLIVHATASLEIEYSDDAGADVRAQLRFDLNGSGFSNIPGARDRWSNRAEPGKTIRNTLRPDGWFWVPAGTDFYQVELGIGTDTLQGLQADRNFNRSTIQVVEFSE